MTTLVKRTDPFIFFKNFFDSDSFFNPIDQCKVEYPVDIYKTNDKLNIEISAIGLNEDEININIEQGNILRVSYQKSEKESKDYLQKSIARRSFNFGWKVDSAYDLEKISATLDKGLLTLTIPLAEKAVTRQIKINA